MSGSTRGPRLAALLLWLLLPRRVRAAVMADLEEEYRTDVLPSRSRRHARLWYWREAGSLLKWYLKDRVHVRPDRDPRRTARLPSGKAHGPMALARRILVSVTQDIRFGVRSLRRRPLFTTVAVVTLGLGIGCTTTMFSVVKGVLLSKLEFENPGQLVTVWETFPNWRGQEILDASWDRNFLSYPEFENLRSGSTVFQDVAIYGDKKMVLTGAGQPLELTVGNASASLSHVLRVLPTLGRWFLPGEDGATAKPLAVLSHAMWQDRFGGEPSVVGKSVVLNDLSYTIVGVLPANFRFRMLLNRSVADPGDRAIWVPTGSPGIQIHQGNHSYEGIARLRPGVTLAQAQSETEALVRGERDPSEVGIRLIPRRDAEISGARAPILILLGATVVLLGIACGNVATLLMGETVSRRAEIVTRAALGAGFWRISRQLLVESLLVGLLGAALGTLLAIVGVKVLVAMGPPIPRLGNVAVNGSVLAFAAIAGSTAGIVFGAFPAISAHPGVCDFRAGGADRAACSRGRRFQRGIVALEIALTAVLLVGGGLLVRSLSSLMAVDPGFDARNVAVARVAVSEQRYPSPAQRAEVYAQLVERIEAVPGVERASGTHRLPFFDRPSGNTIRLEDREPTQRELARIATVLPGFHEILGIPLLAGRTFSAPDNADAPDAMIVNESMARRFWPDESPIGTRVRWYDRTWTVVGIVGDVKHVGLDVDVESTFYVPHAQTGYGEMTLVASTNIDPSRLLPPIREAVWSVDPDLPVTLAGSLESLVSQSTADERYRTLLMTLFATIAAVLAAVGVFGTTARGVAQRTREMGIRLALGARGGSIVGLILHGSLTTALQGVALGLLASFWVSRTLSGFLYGIDAHDPVTFVSVTVLLLTACAAASYVPARRATRVDPAEVLRAE